MQTSVDRNQPLARVKEGMTVVDAAGERIGTVSAVKMGDPEAATTQGNEPASAAAVAAAPAAGAILPTTWRVAETEPDVPEPRRSQLLRVGYLKVDGGGPFSKDRYVAGDEIGGVTDDSVRLAPAPVAPTPLAASGSAYFPAATSRVPAPADEPDESSRSWPTALLGAPVGLLLICGAWAIRRWRQERKRPVNRLRRTARQARERLPSADEIMARAPDLDARTGSIGSAALVGLLAGWLLRERTRPATPSEQVAEVTQPVPGATTQVPAWFDRLRIASRDRRAVLAERRRPRVAVIALSGLVLAVAARRLLRRRNRTLYIGTPGVESALGRDRTRSGELPAYLAREHPSET